jgi:hypothetical protein
MADNFNGRDFDGNPVPLSSDDVGGIQHPRMKIGFGADGSYADVSSDNPVPVREVGGANSLLSRILALLMSPMGFDRSLSRQRVTGIIESGTIGTVSTVTGVTSVGAVTNLSNIDNVQGRLLPLSQNASAWAATHRSCIT